MNSHLLSGDYLSWLGSQISGGTNRTYDGLLDLMYQKEFVWLIPNDDNRLGDGLDLRVEFCHLHGIPMEDVAAFLEQPNANPPCSFLEVLIGLSRRLEFIAGQNAAEWAWCLMANLRLDKISDPVGRRKADRAEEIMHACMFRNYSPDGTGGFFPLTWPEEDQTRVEVWYQMSNYIRELEQRR